MVSHQMTHWRREPGARGSARFTSRVVTVLVALVVFCFGPAAGPALTPVLAAVASAQHVCACGMAEGTCGCPACERLDHERLAERDASPVPVLKGPCGRGPLGLESGSLPPTTLPGDVSLMPPAVAPRLLEPAPSRLTSVAPSAPPTRPA